MSGTAAELADLRLDCRPGKAVNRLVFPYSVTNQGSAEAYVMDALPSVDRGSGAARANPQWELVIAEPGNDAMVGRIIPPLPTDRRIAMPVIPLARRLSRGGTLEGCIEIPEPLAETSPYFADLPLRQYEIVEIKCVVISIGYWQVGSDSLAVLPAEYAPGLFTVVSHNTVRSAKAVSLRFPVRGLQLFRRTDQFPRVVPGWLAPAAALRADPAAA